MKLSEAQLTQYREAGFLALPEFFSPSETAAMQAEVQRLMDTGLLRNVATDGAKANLQLTSVWQHSELFRAAPFHPRVVATAASIVGDPMMLYMEQIFLKPARHGMGTNWHQDNDYFKFPDPMKGVGVWTAIHAATRANGTMRFIPGSHRVSYPHARDPDSTHHVRAYPDETGAVDVELPPGGVVVFTYNTAHATGRNDTDAMRAGFAMHFANIDAARGAGVHLSRTGQVVDYTPGQPGRPILTGDAATRGVREYGNDLGQRWKEAALNEV